MYQCSHSQRSSRYKQQSRGFNTSVTQKTIKIRYGYTGCQGQQLQRAPHVQNPLHDTLEDVPKPTNQPTKPTNAKKGPNNQ